MEGNFEEETAANDRAEETKQQAHGDGSDGEDSIIEIHREAVTAGAARQTSAQKHRLRKRKTNLELEKIIDAQEDEESLFGQTVAAKLRKLPPTLKAKIEVRVS